MDNKTHDDDALRAMKQEALQHVTAGRLAEAQSLYERLCQLAPEDMVARYNLGAVLKDRKRLTEAEAVFRAVLHAKPDLPQALHSLATVLTDMNRLDEAAGYYEQALALAPLAVTHFHLGNVRLRQGRLAEAVTHYEQGLALAPQQPGIHYMLGTTLRAMGRYDEAEAALRTALRLKPAAPIHTGLGAVLTDLGRHDEAITHYREALRLAPGADTHFDLATALGHQYQNDEAITHFRTALHLNPAHLDAWNNLGNVYRQQGRYKAAEECYREVLRLNVDHLQAHLNLGTVLLDSGRPEASLSSYQRALELEPGNRKARIGVVNAYQKQGDVEHAYALLKPLLDVTPIDVDAALAFAGLCRSLGRCDEAITMMEDSLGRDGGSLDVHERIMLHYTVGKLLDAAADYAGAFAHFSRGNALTGQSFDPQAHSAYVNALIDAYSAAHMERAPRASNRSERPVFIVGMLRSGTSLVEQILASHPAVFGAGELEEMDQIAAGLPALLGTDTPYPACVGQLDSAACEQLAQRYLKHLETLGSQGALRVTDKMPGNFLHLGLISQLFPRARIIHCVRDPLDTCLSCFSQHFSQGLSYTNSLTHLGLFYREYRRLMAYWERVIQLPILEVRYEEMVKDQERITRSLLEFCGLDWDERCMHFHNTRRLINTASYDQVRQPLYARSVGRWRHYAEYLTPLKEALGDGPGK